MIFGILATAIVVIALAFGFMEFKEQYVGNNRKVNGKMFGHGILAAMVVGAILFIIAAIVMGVARLIASEMPPSRLDVVSTETYKLAPNSEIDATDGLKLIIVNADGTLEPKSFSYSELTIKDIEANTVEIVTVNHMYPIVAPFPLETITTIVVK